MRRKTKLTLGVMLLGVGVLALSGCTASFCSTTDKAHLASAYDVGVTKYFGENDPNKPTTSYALEVPGVNNICFAYDYDYNNNGAIQRAIDSAKNAGIEYLPNNCEYWAAIDLVFVEKAVQAYGHTINDVDTLNNVLTTYGYLRFASEAETDKLWDNWAFYDLSARNNMVTYGQQNKYGISYNIAKIPTSDFINLYKTTIENAISPIRGCITTQTGQYGNFGWDHTQRVEIQAKSYSYGWSKGFFEGLLVYPIGALIDVMCNAFQGMGNGLNGTNGWAQVVTILLVTLIVRLFMFAVSFKSTMTNARMTELQPQIAKIQAKYPNANTSQAEKARMGEEMNKLYKKNKINPFSSLLVMIVQFPIFICVWGAFTGSAWLSTGSFLGLNLSDSISGVLFNGANWANGSAWTALVLFLLMAGAQVAAMLIPQHLQKRRAAKVAKLGKNPAATSQSRIMKIVTWVMLIMIIVMGFSLASAMGVYWFIGALISLAQSLITQHIVSKKSN